MGVRVGVVVGALFFVPVVNLDGIKPSAEQPLAGIPQQRS